MENRIFSDKDLDIFDYERKRDQAQPYPQRTIDLIVVQTGNEVGVKVHIIMSPLIYGLGSGHFNISSIQVPGMIRAALEAKRAEVIGQGKGVWDHVHIADLVLLYEIMVVKLLSGESLPNGEQGIYFSEAGQQSWMDVAQALAGSLYQAGVTQTGEVTSMGLEEASSKWTGGDTLLAELGFASKYVLLLFSS